MKTILDQEQYETLKTINGIIGDIDKAKIYNNYSIVSILKSFYNEVEQSGLISFECSYDIYDETLEWLPTNEDEVEFITTLDDLDERWEKVQRILIDDLKTYKELYTDAYRRYEGAEYAERKAIEQ
jgi:hypothetical protein